MKVQVFQLTLVLLLSIDLLLLVESTPKQPVDCDHIGKCPRECHHPPELDYSTCHCNKIDGDESICELKYDYPIRDCNYTTIHPIC